MRHAIIIRFHYPKGDARFKWRLNYFKSMVLPRLRGQKGCQPFDICIWCNEWHDRYFKALSLKTFRPVKERAERKGIYWIDFVTWKSIRGLEQYEIQSGLDSDDLVAPDYVKTIEETIMRESDGRPMHLSFQEEIFDIETLKIYPMKARYTPRRGSAFFSIYQPGRTHDYVFAYQDSHLRLWRYFPKSVTIPKGKCWATVHGLNESTKIR